MVASVALVLGSFAVLTTDPEAVKAELKKLDGTWNLVYREREKVKDPIPLEKWVFKSGRAGVHYEQRPVTLKPGQSWTFAPNEFNRMCDYVFELDPTASPKAFSQYTEFKGAKPLQKIPQIGIYKLEGDTLTLCFAGVLDKGKRPSEFVTVKGVDRVLKILKRDKK